MLAKDLLAYAPGTNNRCKDGMTAIWIAPGDLCAMQAPGGLRDYPKFAHCSDSRYTNDFELDHHVKACLPYDDIKTLWQSGHCHDTTTSLPFLNEMQEGLLLCKKKQVFSCTQPETFDLGRFNVTDCIRYTTPNMNPSAPNCVETFMCTDFAGDRIMYTNCTPEDKAPCVAQNPGVGYTCPCDQEYATG